MNNKDKVQGILPDLKYIIGTQTGKADLQLSLLAADKVLNTESPENSTKTLLKLISGFSKVTRIQN